MMESIAIESNPRFSVFPFPSTLASSKSLRIALGVLIRESDWNREVRVGRVMMGSTLKYPFRLRTRLEEDPALKVSSYSIK